MSDKTKRVDVRLPPAVLRSVDVLVSMRILGETREQVMIHILREHIFQEMQRNAARQTEGRVAYVPE